MGVPIISTHKKLSIIIWSRILLTNPTAQLSTNTPTAATCHINCNS